MSGLLFLTSDDFGLNKGVRGNIMCNTIQGFSLVLFYSTQCDHCKELIPIFKQLPGTVGGCQFGMINVSNNRKCVIMSRDTIAPIQVVPYIILYINGKPYMRYQGPHVKGEISRFVVEVSKNVQNKQKLITREGEESGKIKVNPGGGIPAYTLGQPLCGPDDKVCYLEFNSAYGSNGGAGNPPNKNRMPQAAGMS